MKAFVLIWLQVWCSVNLKIHALRILAVFPTPYSSHQSVFRPLTEELARRGHQVLVITADPSNKGIDNLKEIDMHNVSYTFKNEFAVKYTGNDDLGEVIENFFDMFSRLFEIQLMTNEVKTLIQDKGQSFDLVIAEAVLQPALIFSHIYKAPVILISALGTLNTYTASMGVQVHPFLYPTINRIKIYNLTLLEKLREFVNNYALESIIRHREIEDNKILKRIFGPDIPLLEDLKRNVSVLFMNVHHIWENYRSVPPNVVYLGGLHLASGTEKNLPKDMKAYLDSSKNGVIYASFGSHLIPSQFAVNKLEILLNVFSKLPYDILLKWDEDELPISSNNIKIFKWLPQAALLKHPKIKLFITQGGLQSTDEAIIAGVPMIGIPIVADQFYNTEQYVHFGIGMKLYLYELTEEGLIHAVNNIIGDQSYRQNILKLRTLILDQPQTSLERAVWWTEYVARHRGAPHFHQPSADMSSWEYFEINLLLAVLMTVILLVAAVYAVVRRIVTWMKSKLKKD